MPVTKEQVVAKAKELGKELTEDQVNVFVSLGVLPTAAESGSATGDGDGDGDGDGGGDGGDTGGDGAKKRIQQLANEKKAMKQQLADLAAKVRAFEEKDAAASRKTEEEKGNYQKLLRDAEDAKTKAESTVAKSKERFKSTAVKSAVETALLEAGVPSARLGDAVRLFDASKVEFSWKNEDELDYEIDDFKTEVESFKKAKAFLFGGDSDDGSDSGFQGRRPPQSGSPKGNEKKRLELLKQFPALRR